VIVAGAEDSARFLLAVRQDYQADASFNQHSLTVYGAPAMGRARFVELAGASAEGVRFPLLACPDAADSRAATFIANFLRARGRRPDYAALLMHDGTRLLTEAIQRAGPNRARIREALAQCSPWVGVGGPVHFDGTGQNTVANLRMATIHNGAIASLPPRRAPTQTTQKLQTP
jgi:ABC-type branched-subunit amino acid transport system substrate-binding protein